MKQREFLGKSSLLKLVPSLNKYLKFDEVHPDQSFVSLEIENHKLLNECFGGMFKLSLAKFEGDKIVNTFFALVEPKNNIQQVIEEITPILRNQKIVVLEKDNNFGLFVDTLKNAGYNLYEYEVVDVLELTKKALTPLSSHSIAQLVAEKFQEVCDLGGAILVGGIYLELMNLPLGLVSKEIE